MDTQRPKYVSVILAVLVGCIVLLQLMGIELPFSLSASAVLGKLGV